MSTETRHELTRTDNKTLSLHALQGTLRLGLAVVSELWVYKMADWVISVHAADIDNDGDIEVLIGSRDGHVAALSKKGTLKWKKHISEQWVGTVFGIKAVDGKGARVIVGTRDNKIYGLDKTGEKLWDFTTEYVVRQVYAQDIDGDGKVEVIAGSEDRYVYALDSEKGNLLWKYATDGWVRTVYAHDIDGDGQSEILAGSSDKYLYVLDSGGQLKWKHDAKYKIHRLFATDLDRDGKVEILIGSTAKDLYALTPERQEKWRLRPGPENRVLSLCVADINDDGRCEVIAGSEDKHIYFLDDHGRLLWKHHHESRVFDVCTIDLNRDGIMELLVASEDKRVHVLRVELAKGLYHKILNCHNMLGQPKTRTLHNLSPTECALLEDILQEDEHAQDVTLKHIEALLKTQKYSAALAQLLRLQQQKVQVLWKKSRNIGHIRTVCFGDIASDRKLEIIMGTDDGKVYALSASGRKLWSYDLNERIWMLHVGDVNQDGVVEVVTCTADRHVHVLSNSGKEVIIGKQIDDFICSVYLSQPNSHGNVEIVMGAEKNKIYIYDGNLSDLRKVIETPQGIRIVCTHDLNVTGTPEIIGGTVDNHVYAYTYEGDMLWEYETWDRVRALCVKDIDHDGQVEVLVASEDRNVHVLDSQGRLKWRYFAYHRVLDVDAVDIDHDGEIEILLGVADGHMYVLSSLGDLLWKYQSNDRVRVVRASDLNQDGKIEIVVGSEDRLDLLQMLDQKLIEEQIAHCWAALQHGHAVKSLIYKLLKDDDPHVRSFALKKLAEQGELVEKDFDLFHTLLNDPAKEVRIALAHVIARLYQINPRRTRRLLHQFSCDPQQEVKLAFIDALPALAQLDWEVSFEYLDSFSNSVDRWIRRAVVRKLYQLIEIFPAQVFEHLLAVAQDETAWVRQESARAFAHYFDTYTNELIEGVHIFNSRGIHPVIIEQLAYCATNPVVRRVFHALFNLLTDVQEGNVLKRVAGMVQAFEAARFLKYGEESWIVYSEFYRLLAMHAISDIAQYQCTLDQERFAVKGHFEQTFAIFNQLTDIGHVLKIYLRRDSIGDRLVSLLDANTAIERAGEEVDTKYFPLIEQKNHTPNRLIFAILLKKWRQLVLAEISRQRGSAEIKVELQTKTAFQEQQVAVVLKVSNEGNSPADNVIVRLEANTHFAIIGPHERFFETLPTQRSLETEFTIQPNSTSLRLEFQIVYADADADNKLLPYADWLELQGTPPPFRRIVNPYSTGAQNHDLRMFYGREETLEQLKENLITTSANMIVVLYGQRRSGKTTLLRYLASTSILEPHIPVFMDMQGETLEFSTGKFLYHAALAISNTLSRKDIAVQEPPRIDFERDPTLTFSTFLEQVQTVLGDRKLIMLIDEFEVLEQKVREKRLDPEMFPYLRNLMQHQRGLNFLLSGTHTLKQLTAEYWAVFFNIARHHQLSKLNEAGAVKLITEPVKEALTYDPLAITKIRRLTANQPYLIHLICWSLVGHCNRNRKSYVTINDVNVVLGEVLETGQVHFSWIWGRTSPEGRFLLSILAQRGGDEGRLSLADIEEEYERYGFPYRHDRVLEALHHLINEDVVEDFVNGTQYRILVGLTREWLRREKSPERVILEEDIAPG